MSSSDRRTLLFLLAALPAAACGFTPAYAPNGPARGLMGQVRADDPGDKFGFAFVSRIQDRLGTAEAPKYRLGYRISVGYRGVAITPTNAITRYNVTGTIAYTLHDAASGKLLTEGTVNGFTSYSATGTTISTLAAQTDAERRLMRILADQVVTRLIATSRDWAR